MPQLINGNSSRIVSLDAARGVAMLLVCLAHFSDVYLFANRLGPAQLPQQGSWALLLLFIPRMASPIFFVLSGMVVAYLFRTKGQEAGAFRLHLIDKALFLMTIGHLLIAITTAARTTFLDAMRHGYVTDTLAVCTIGTLLLLPHTGAMHRLLLGLTIYLGSWASWYVWIPGDASTMLIKDFLLGPDRGEPSLVFFPLLPWFGVHLIGSSIGEYLSYLHAGEIHWKGGRQLALIGAAIFMTGLAIKVTVKALNAMDVFPLDPAHHPIVAPLQKYPPGPLYLLVFGGAAMILIGMLLLSEKRLVLSRSIYLVSALGRNAFPAFLLQYLIYYTVFYLFVTKTILVTTWVAVVFLILSIVSLLAMITWLDRYAIHRAWTVGLSITIRRWGILNH